MAEGTRYMKRKHILYKQAWQIFLLCIGMLFSPASVYVKSTSLHSSILSVSAFLSQISDLRHEDENPYSLNATDVKLLRGKTFNLSVNGINDEDVSFHSNSPAVTISHEQNNHCICKGKSIGSADITIHITQRTALILTKTLETLHCHISVTPKAVSIRFRQKNYKLRVGQKKQLSIILRPSISTELPKYSSSNKSIVSVSNSGQILAKDTGTAIITAKISNGVKAKCKVKVRPEKQPEPTPDSTEDVKQ
jgi:hypothetical protein